MRASCGAPGFSVKPESTVTDQQVEITFNEYTDEQALQSGGMLTSVGGTR